MAEKFLAFDEWKTKYHPAWYLNSQELKNGWNIKELRKPFQKTSRRRACRFFVSGNSGNNVLCKSEIHSGILPLLVLSYYE